MGINRRGLIIGALLLSVSGAALSAHHSFAAFYFENQSVTLEGAVQEFQFRSPHSILLFTAPTPEGPVATYAAEWANPSRLERDGMTKDTLKVSDVVRIWGSPSRDPNDGRIHLKRIVRQSDGWEWRPRRR